jgi:hypothetical protein
MKHELTTPESLNAHIDTLVELVQVLPLTGVSILTGGNGRGKSLVRQQLVHPTKKAGLRLASTSLEKRTSSNPDLGCLSGMNRDLAWLPSSVATLDQVEGVLKARYGVPTYVVIDEPELGMGEETVLALGTYLTQLLAERPEAIVGVLIITHSRQLVASLAYDNFYNLDGYETAQQWLTRPVVAADLAALRLNALSDAIQARSRQVEM